MNSNNLTVNDIKGKEALRRPVVSGRPVEIASGVFVIPDGGVELVPNVGVIVGDRAALVVDTGLGPRNGAIVRAIADELAGNRPLFLTLTHFHPEHGFGAQAFADATIIYNRKQHEEFREKAAGYLAMFSAFGDAIADELAGVQFVDPQIVYDGSVDLDLGGKAVQLRTWGPAHTREDQGIYLPAEKILFVGDLVENRSFPVLPFFPPQETEVDAREWMAVLEQLQRMDVETVVPGHGDVGDRGLLATAHEYLAWLESETNRLADKGEDPEKIPGIVVPELIARYPQWSSGAQPWLIAAGVLSVLAKRA
jgi:glyoxylase-like metal-dependent hydrolase (beta-lactamase superfamily II)